MSLHSDPRTWLPTARRVLVAPAPASLVPRWLFLRALGAIFFSAFYALHRQILGLVGSGGISSAARYLHAVEQLLPGVERFHLVPTIFWVGASDAALRALPLVGMAASLALTANLWPRGSLVVCETLFLSAIAVLQQFAAYQSDGMLLEAGFVAIFFAPPGVFPGLGSHVPPSRVSLFLLRWEWFRIYFESGIVKLASGDPQWRNLTAMDHYYENGPLPTWIGWWAEQLPHAWHAATALETLVVELALVFMVWLPRPFRRFVFVATALLQVAIITTANYAFLNYLVLSLGLVLLDDRLFAHWLPHDAVAVEPLPAGRPRWWTIALAPLGFVFLGSIGSFLPLPPPLSWPAHWLEPLRLGERYGLFAVMTRQRLEIEFQGTLDGMHWKPYRFRYKPQDPDEQPGIYAPYQPRFDWNLWFASLGPWQSNRWVLDVEAELAESSPEVLSLFRGDPFDGQRPRAVRSVLWRYEFTDRSEHRATGAWWRRQLLGEFAPAVGRGPNGELRIDDQVELPPAAASGGG